MGQSKSTSYILKNSYLYHCINRFNNDHMHCTDRLSLEHLCRCLLVRLILAHTEDLIKCCTNQTYQSAVSFIPCKTWFTYLLKESYSTEIGNQVFHAMKYVVYNTWKNKGNMAKLVYNSLIYKKIFYCSVSFSKL